MVNRVQGYGGVRTINYSIRRSNSDTCDTAVSEIDKILPSAAGVVTFRRGSSFSEQKQCTEIDETRRNFGTAPY